MTKVIEVTNLRLLTLTLDTTRDCIIVKYAEEDAQGRAVAFGKAVFFAEYPQGRGPFENWYLMERGDAQAVRAVASGLMRRLREMVLGEVGG